MSNDVQTADAVVAAMMHPLFSHPDLAPQAVDTVGNTLSQEADPRPADQQMAQLEVSCTKCCRHTNQDAQVARRYTIKLSEIIQEQARDLDSQAAAYVTLYQRLHFRNA